MLRGYYENWRGQNGAFPETSMLRFQGGVLHGEAGTVLATLQPRRWFVSGWRMHRIEIVGPLAIQFEFEDERPVDVYVFPLLILFAEALFADARLLATFSHLEARWCLEDSGAKPSAIQIWSLAKSCYEVNRQRLIAAFAARLTAGGGLAQGIGRGDWLVAERRIDAMLTSKPFPRDRSSRGGDAGAGL